MREFKRAGRQGKLSQKAKDFLFQLHVPWGEGAINMGGG